MNMGIRVVLLCEFRTNTMLCGAKVSIPEVVGGEVFGAWLL
jgi:hypothetical protein